MRYIALRSCRWAGWIALVIGLVSCAHDPLRTQPPAHPHIQPGAVIYGVVPPLFGNDPLNDVAARLDYLEELGVDLLLLSPINASDDRSSISYSISDHFAVRSDFGDLEDLIQLVREAHRRNMRVLMDFVPNHTSTSHPFHIDVEARGAASPFYDFYDRDPTGRITHYFDWLGLPNLNYDNPELFDYMSDAFGYWIRQTGIDGYRVDVAWGIRERSPQVWEPLIGRLRALDPQLAMIAEAGARDPFYVRNGFDLAYDWTEKPGQWAWEPVFENLDLAGPLLHKALTKDQSHPQSVLRFLNNNDTGRRFFSRHGPEVTRVAAVLQHTVPGVPLVYTGDEVGAEYEPYEDPPPIAWHDPHGLRDLYRRLAFLREELPALHSGAFIPLPPQANASAYAFLRAADRRNWVLVILNFGPFAEIDLEGLPEGFKKKCESGFNDLISGNRIEPGLTEEGHWVVSLNAISALILEPPCQ